MNGPAQKHDNVDLIVQGWLEEDPELDVKAKTAALRLRRATNYLERELRRELVPLDAEMWELEVLLALRRAPGQRMSVASMLRLCQVTSGALSNRLARMEAKGWICRAVDVRDRRQVLVSMTDDGAARAWQLIAGKERAEQRLFAGIDRATLERLGDDLRTLLLSIEGSPDEGCGPDDQWDADPE